MQIRLSRPPPGISPGQTLEIRVLERIPDGRFLIDAGSARLTAETQHALQPGQTLEMRVESLRPRVVLSVLPSPAERLVAEHLRGFRSNPAAPARALADLAGVPGRAGAGDLPAAEGRDSLAAVIEALRAALPGRERIAQGLSLPDFARALGLFTERDLKKVLDGPGEKRLSPTVNLKSCLMRVIRETAPESVGIIREWARPWRRPCVRSKPSRSSTFTCRKTKAGSFSRFPCCSPVSRGRRTSSSAGRERAPGRIAAVGPFGCSLPSTWTPWAM
jgi:hypothetical protein